MIEPEPGEEPGALPIEDNEYLAGGSSFMHGSLK
jgi:hypothetical protein